MLTKEQLKDKGFTFIKDNKEGPSNDGSYWVFRFNRKTKNKIVTDLKYVPAELQYFYNTGVTKVTDYFEQPIQLREYHYMGYLRNIEDLNKMLDILPFTIENYEQ